MNLRIWKAPSLPNQVIICYHHLAKYRHNNNLCQWFVVVFLFCHKLLHTSRGAWQAMVHEVAKSWTQPSNWAHPSYASYHTTLKTSAWTVACQAPLSMKSPGKNTGVGSHSLFQQIFLTQIKPGSPALQADSLLSEPPGKPQTIFTLGKMHLLYRWVEIHKGSNNPSKVVQIPLDWYCTWAHWWAHYSVFCMAFQGPSSANSFYTFCI